jgi:hypothetical protein
LHPAAARERLLRGFLLALALRASEQGEEKQ